MVRLEYSPQNNSNLLGVGYLDRKLSIVWTFPSNDVTGIEVEIPERKKPEEFVTHDHYQKYIEKFGGKEILIVYAEDFGYRIDANTGQIYGQWENR